MKQNNNEFRKKLIGKAFGLAKKSISLVNRFPNSRSAYVIIDQLIRAISSIGANIIEAQAASSKRDFINFLTHALKSANESKFWLALSKEVAPNLVTEADYLLKETTEVAKILGSSIATLKGKKLV